MKKGTKMKEEGIVDYLEDLKLEIDKIIEKYFPKKATKKWLNFAFGKSRYQFNLKAAEESLSKPIWDFLARGGKGWRPALFLLIAEAVGGDVKKVKDFAIIPELIHQGTIIIDDIEDKAELRRGKPSLHRIFGTDIALNAGNFLYFFPLLSLIKNRRKFTPLENSRNLNLTRQKKQGFLTGFKPEMLVRAYEIYIQEMVNLGLGQGTDIYWHRGNLKGEQFSYGAGAEKIDPVRKRHAQIQPPQKAGFSNGVDEKEYLQMVAFKTGCLSRLSAKLAVVLSGSTDELAEKLGRMAEAIGVAFQVQDDILDINLEGREREKFGKSFGNDIKEGKRTLLVIHTFKKANPRDKKRLVEILNKHTDNPSEIKEAIGIIKKQGSVEYAKKTAKKIVSDAWQEVNKLLPESKAKKRLKDFVNYLIERRV